MNTQFSKRIPESCTVSLLNVRFLMTWGRNTGSSGNQCRINYVGGPGQMHSCYISPNTVWAFAGPVPMILDTLRECGWRIEYGTGPDSEPIRFPSDAM